MSAKSVKSGGKSESEPEPRKPRAAKTAAAKPAAKKAPSTKKAAAKKAPAKKAPAKQAAARKTVAKKAAATAKKSAPPARRKAPPPELQVEPQAPATPLAGQVPAAAEARGESSATIEAYRAEVAPEAEQGRPESEPQTRPEPNLERLQKILSHAGVASRRHAEEMIVAGRVIVNGQVVTQLGAKADPARDHIRVDGKLLQTAVRRRTFMLNKPRGYVTTVSDPEGRPTVMQFFEKIRERLFPVGRLDFQSEGLLLVTNDGELANALTRAAAGVEKIYLVKVAGQPGADAIERLRSGVSIERGDQGSDRVRVAPAQLRQIRQGDNPWFEVVLTEGRNRELRKMFHAIGHYAEKIRRVAYGPLTLDIEPGQIRELRPEEIDALRLAAAGKLKPKRPRADAFLPKEAGRLAEERTGFRARKGGEGRPPRRAAGAPSFPRPLREKDGRLPPPREDRPFSPRGERGAFRREGPPRFAPPARREAGARPEGERRRFDRPAFNRPGPDRPASDRPGLSRPGFDRPGSDRPGFDRGKRRPFGGPREQRPRPEGQRENRFAGPRQQRGGERGGFGQRPPRDRQEFGREERPRGELRPPEEGAPRGARPAPSGGERRGWNRQENRPGGFREARPRREGPPRSAGERERRPSNGRAAQNRRPGSEGGRPGGFRKGGPPRRGRS